MTEYESPEKFCFETYWEDEKTAFARVEKDHADITRYVIHPVKQIFYKDRMTRYELGEILKSRCFDEGRPDISKLLSMMGLSEYDIYKICRYTHGRMVQDKIWFKYDGEDLTWKDVKRC